jgi:hypothetical protein
LSSDWVTKLLLTVIAACLALLVAQGYREGAGAGASGLGEGRFRLTFVPGARMLVRIDSDTGKTSKAQFPDLKAWTPVADSPSELLDEVPAEAGEDPAPSPPQAVAPEEPGGAVTP